MDSTGASTSGASGATDQSDVSVEIHKLFSWNPRELYHDPGSMSTKTRGPSESFYDKHFKKDLVLRKVEHISGLLTDLTENVQNLLRKEAPAVLDGFITAKLRENLSQDLSTFVKDENEVANYYGSTTARYCARVASTLALHPTSKSWHHNLLYWTQTSPHSNYAIADGCLCFMSPPGPKNENHPNEIGRKANVERMDPEIRLIFEEMRKDRSPLALWEIKSITSGPFEVMVAARDFRNFAWVYCRAPDCPLNVQVSRPEKSRKDVDKAIVGPDALNPPWKLPVSLHSLNRQKKVVHHPQEKFFKYQRDPRYRPIRISES